MKKESSQDTLSFTNLQTTWTSDRYYNVGLIAFVLGLSNNLQLFNNLKDLGAGLIGPYILFSMALGIPMVILELCLSQYGQKGMIRIWALCPVFKGMGYLCLIYLFVTVVEELTVLAYLARYLINSFSTQSGWDSCNNEWNTEFCFTLETNVSRRLDCYDVHGKPKCDKAMWESSHSQYWRLVVQNIDIGMFQWKNVAYCLGVVLIAFALTFKGVMVIEKVVYWALIFAAIEFAILLYCSLIQHGSGSGLIYIFHWQWNIFKNKKPWIICFQHVIHANGLGCDSTSIFVPGKINDRSVKILVDTGSTRTIVRPEIAEGLKCRPAMIKLRTASGQEIPTYGSVISAIELGSIIVKHEVLVAEITEEVILGLDLVKKLGCQLDMKKDVLRLGIEEIPFNDLDDKTYKIRLTEDITLPGRTEGIVTDKCGLRTLGGQNKFRGHSYMTGMMLILVNITVTILYTFLYLSLCGNLSYFSNQSIESIMKDQEPEFWSKVPRMLQRLNGPSRLWQWLFYSQVFLTVFSKSIVITFVVVRTIFNRFPKVENYFAVISCALYCCAFVCCTPMFTTFSMFVQKHLLWMVVKGPMIILMNVIQTVVILYIYGLTTVVDDLHFMLGFRLPFYWQILLLMAPVIMSVMWILSLWNFYDELPLLDISLAKKLIMNTVLYVPIFLCIGYAIYYARWMIWKCKWENVFRPSDSWYLSDPILRKSRQMFSAMSMTKEYLYRQTKKQEKAAYDLDETAYDED